MRQVRTSHDQCRAWPRRLSVVAASCDLRLLWESGLLSVFGPVGTSGLPRVLEDLGRERWSHVLASAAVASTVLTAEVEVEREEGAQGCPDTAALTARIEDILQRPLAGLSPAATPIHAKVQFRRTQDGYEAHLQFRGPKPGERVLKDRASRCEPLAEAVSVAVALLLDRGLDRPRQPNLGSSATPPPDSKSSEAPRPGPSITGARGQPLGDAAFELHGSVGGGLMSGLAHPVSALFTADLALRTASNWLFTATFGVVPASGTPFGEGEVQTSLVMGSLGTCKVYGYRYWLGPCAWVGVGRLRGVGVGYDEERSNDMLWTAVGVGVVAEGIVWGPLLLGMTANLWVPARQQSFSVENAGVAWESSVLSGSVAWRAGVYLQ